jgi:hypothetical protein
LGESVTREKAAVDRERHGNRLDVQFASYSKNVT